MSPGRPRLSSGYYGWRIVAVLAVTETVSWGVLYYAFSVFLAPMQRDLGLSAGAVSGAFSLALVVMGVSGLGVGRWLDRHGGRGVMTAGAVLASVVVLAWSQVREPWQLYAVFVVLGLASSMVLYEPAFAVVVRWFDRQRSRALLVVTLVAGLASTIFVPAAAALEQRLGWRDALVVLAVVLAVATVLPHALVLRRDPRDLGLPSHREPTEPVGQAGGPALREPGLRATGRAMWSQSRFRRLTVAFSLHELAITAVAVHLFPFLREQGHGVGFAAGVTGSLGVLSVVGRLVVTGLFVRYATVSVTAVVFGLQAVGTVLLLVAPGEAAAAVGFALLFGIGFGVSHLARPALVAEGYGVRRFATIAALMGLALTAAKVVGPVAVGVSRSATGSYTPALVGLVLATAGSAAALVAASRR